MVQSLIIMQIESEFWSINKAYPKSTVVKIVGAYYVSIKDVPKGIRLNNTDYWLPLRLFSKTKDEEHEAAQDANIENISNIINQIVQQEGSGEIVIDIEEITNEDLDNLFN